MSHSESARVAAHINTTVQYSAAGGVEVPREKSIFMMFSMSFTIIFSAYLRTLTPSKRAKKQKKEEGKKAISPDYFLIREWELESWAMTTTRSVGVWRQICEDRKEKHLNLKMMTRMMKEEKQVKDSPLLTSRFKSSQEEEEKKSTTKTLQFLSTF